MLYTLKFRQVVVGVREVLIEADDQIEAEWRGRAYCDAHPEIIQRFVSVLPAVVADKVSYPMPKAEVTKKAARVGA